MLFRSLRTQQGTEIPASVAVKAQKVLDKKMEIDANNAHESIIFKKYVELRNCQKVADYFKIPRLHVLQVVKKTKTELKHAINN